MEDFDVAAAEPVVELVAAAVTVSAVALVEEVVAVSAAAAVEPVRSARPGLPASVPVGEDVAVVVFVVVVLLELELASEEGPAVLVALLVVEPPEPQPALE